MPKYYKRKYYYRGSRDKYSVEQQGGTVTNNASGDGGVVVVPASTTQGMRKVKHITVSMAANVDTTSSALWWALVYVPQGTGVGVLNVSGSGTLYEPNQFVMDCGAFDFDGGPLRVHCPISRNLNSGDQIALIIKGTANLTFRYVVKYAITLQ